MRGKTRFSLKMLLLMVLGAALITSASLNGDRWYADYLDWQAARQVRARAAKVFREEVGKTPPAELIHILGSGELSHWAEVYDIGVTSQQIVSCGLDDSVRCWSSETGELLQVIRGVKGHVAADATLLVTIDKQHQARVYDTSATPLKPLRSFSLASLGPFRYTFASPVDRTLAVVSKADPRTVHLFDLKSGKKKLTFHSLEDADPGAVGFRKDGAVLAIGHEAATLIDSATGTVLTRCRPDWTFERGDGVRHVAPLRPPWWLLGGVFKNLVWNETTHEILECERSFSGSTEFAIADRFGDVWLDAMQSVTVRDGQVEHKLRPLTRWSGMACMDLRSYVGGGQVFRERAIGNRSGQIRLIDHYGHRRLPQDDVDHLTAVGWSSDGKWLAIGNADGEVIVLQTGSWNEVQRFSAHGGPIEYLEFSPDGEDLLAEESHEVAVFNWRRAKTYLRKPRQVSPSRRSSLAAGEGRLLTLISGEGWSLTNYTTDTLIAKSEPRAAKPQFFTPQGAVWSEQKQCFFYVSQDELIRLSLADTDASDGPKLELDKESMPDASDLRDIAADELRSLHVVYGEGHVDLKIVDFETFETKPIKTDAEGGTKAAAFDSSGDRVAAVLDGKLLIYSEAGEELYRATIGAAEMKGSQIEYSPQGRYLAVLNGNGTCYLFKNPPFKET